MKRAVIAAIALPIIFAGISIVVGLWQVRAAYVNSPVINVYQSKDQVRIDGACGNNHTVKVIDNAKN